MNKTNTYTPPKTIEQAFAECQKVIQKCATKFTRNHFAMREDYEQQCAIGIVDAWHRYDPTKNKNKFSTYAYYSAWARCQEFADYEWKTMNTKTEYDVNAHDNDYYDLDIDNNIDFERSLSKVDELSLEVYHLRMEGETFDTIANRLPGIRNLQHARNTYIEVENRLRETY